MTELAAPALHPRSAPQLFDAIFGLARRHAWDFFALGMLFHLPVHVFRIAGAFAGRGSMIAAWDPERYLGSLWWILWNSLAVTACAVAACQIYDDGTTSVRRALEEMRAGGWRLFGTVAMFGVLVDGSWALINNSATAVAYAPLSLLFFSTMLVWCAPAVPAAEVERVAPWTAMRRAAWLVRHNFWRVAIAVWIVWGLTSIGDSSLVNLVFAITHRGTASSVADLPIDAALYPLRGIVLAVVYFDCRVRREAYDLERMLDAA